MKISEFNAKITSANLNESIKDKFGYTLNLNALTLSKAETMLTQVKENIRQVKAKLGEKAVQNKTYFEKKLIAETLTKFVAEKRKVIQLETRQARLRAKLNESQTKEAEAVLAAKDMVDRIQGILEDVGEMQNEQLHPLVDSVREALGEETASSFDAAMSGAIDTIMQAVRTARTEADNAARILTGDAAADDDLLGDDDMEMDGDLGLDDEDGDEIDLDLDVDAVDDTEEIAGRETRDMEI